MKIVSRLSLFLLMGNMLLFNPSIRCAETHSPFAVRGTLPWHNFLSGPTAWNYENYTEYLDRMAEMGMNFVGFHCYTGGLERYVNYVEPLIRIEYRKVVPTAEFDTSITARWGYSPLTTNRFRFGVNRLFSQDVFGSDCAIHTQDREERYLQAQDLMRRVIQYAHTKRIRVCLGFEFGIYPPELYSIVPPDSMFQTPYLPDPTHPASIEILELYIRNILQTYPDIDYIWFWLQELNPSAGELSLSESFHQFYEDHKHRFSDLKNDFMKFNGVWSLAYILQAYEILQREAPKVRMAISGWGGSTQLPPLLKGLHESVPKEVIFSCLNPLQGWDPQREIMGKLTGREVWIIPWLEGDQQLWHPQPRVSLLAEQIAMAKNQGIQGVIGIHWRTKDIAANFTALGQMANSPPAVDGIRLMTAAEKTKITRDFYKKWCDREYGVSNAKKIEPFLTRWDIQQILALRKGGVESPEYFHYEPNWGYLPAEIEKEVKIFLDTVINLRNNGKEEKYRTNLEYLENTLRFILLLHETGVYLKPAYALKNAFLAKKIPKSEQSQEFRAALDNWKKAPLEELFTTYAKRVQSRGEMGVMSSINQKLGVFAMELKEFLEERQK